MARKFQSKNKDLVKLEVKTAKDVWNKKDNKYRLKDDFDYYGKVQKGFSSSITSNNKDGNNHKFVDDFSNLPKKTKNAITNEFLNNKRKVVYLVRKK